VETISRLPSQQQAEAASLLQLEEEESQEGEIEDIHESDLLLR
jgi:hypothetical protein